MANPAFQHRHYKAIAATIATLRHDQGEEIAQAVAERFADTFETDNARFNRKRFLDAAKGTPSNGRDKVRRPILGPQTADNNPRNANRAS